MPSYRGPANCVRINNKELQEYTTEMVKVWMCAEPAVVCYFDRWNYIENQDEKAKIWLLAKIHWIYIISVHNSTFS